MVIQVLLSTSGVSDRTVDVMLQARVVDQRAQQSPQEAQDNGHHKADKAQRINEGPDRDQQQQDGDDSECKIVSPHYRFVSRLGVVLGRDVLRLSSFPGKFHQRLQMRLREIDWLLPQRHVSHRRGLAVPPVQELLGGCHPDPCIIVVERPDQHSNRGRRVAADLLAKFSRQRGPARRIA
jgi:hypothetical protein